MTMKGISSLEAYLAPGMNVVTGHVRQYPQWVIATVAVLSSLLVYLPFLHDGTFDVIYRYWDGPNYAYLAQSLYDIPRDHPLSAYTTPEYFAAHLPVYPLSIRLLSFVGYFDAMLLVSIIYGALAGIVLFKLLRETNTVTSPLWSAVISMFIPARYLIYHSVGATEAPFIFFTLWSMLAYVRGQYVLSFALAGVSGITRITGILIGGAYFCMLVSQKKWKVIPLLALVGLPLLLTFTFYHFHYGDFWAYFGTNYSESNKLINLNPFQLFKIYAGNGNTHSAEFYLMLYGIYGAGTALLWHKNKLFFWYCAVTFCFSVFIFHQDVSRYLIPMAPLALVVAYDPLFSKKAFKLAFLPFLSLVYIYTWGMLPNNVIDTGNFRKLERYLTEQNSVDEINGEFDRLTFQSCAYQGCQSKVSNTKGQYLVPSRGLNVYRYANRTLTLVKVYDLCSHHQALEEGPLLASLWQPETEKLVLVVDDTLPCSHEKPVAIEAWANGATLPKLLTLQFREAYVGVLDKRGESVERKNRKTVKHRPHKR